MSNLNNKPFKLNKILFLFIVFIFFAITATSQDTEFWFGAPDDSNSHGECDRPIFIMITTTNQPATVQIFIGSTLRGTVHIAANSYHREDFTTTADVAAIENLITDGIAGTVQNKAIHITSTVPVSAYYQIDGSCSKDVFTLKGSKALGTHFITPFQTRYGVNTTCTDGYNHFVITATVDNTVVTIKSRGTTTADRPNPSSTHTGTGSPIYRPDGQGGTVTAGTSFNIKLDRGQTYTVRELNRRVVATNSSGYNGRGLPTLAGTEVTSNNPIAITVAEPGTIIRSGSNAAYHATDLLGDQIVPVSELGTHHAVVPGFRGNYDEEWIYLTATENNTVITARTSSTSTTSSPTLNKGQHWAYQMTTTNGVFFTSNSPVYCYHQSASNSEVGASLIPSLFSIAAKSISFYRQGGGSTFNTYIFLMFRTGTHGSFRINGANPNISNTAVTAIQGTNGWSFAKVNISVNASGSGLCTIENANSAFSMGFFSYVTNTTTSYGYLSKFGSFTFGSDTIYKCKNSSYPLDAGYNLGQQWTLPDGSTQTGPIIYAADEGLYSLTVDQDYIIVKDSVYIKNRFSDISLAGPGTITTGVPQKYYVDLGGEYSNNAVYKWTVSGGSYPVQATDTVYYTWTDNSIKTIMVEISDSELGCDTTLYLSVSSGATGAMIDALPESICPNETAGLTASSIVLTAPVTYRWYSSQTSTTALDVGSNFTTPALTTTTIYYVSAQNATYGENAPGNRKEVVVTVKPLLTPDMIKIIVN